MPPLDPGSFSGVVDLSHSIGPNMPLYPGTPPPELTQPHTLDRDGFNQRKIEVYSHVGTHLDAPAHLLKNGDTLDRFPINHFFGPGLKLDVSRSGKKQITPRDLAPWEALLPGADFVLLQTGWSRRWGRPEYFEDFPALSPEAAELLGSFHLKGVGVDALSVDLMNAPGLPVHHALLTRKIIIIENLAGLDQLPESGFMLSIFPWKMEGADGCPVRAVAILP